MTHMTQKRGQRQQQSMTRRHINVALLAIGGYLMALASITPTNSMELFQVKLIEQDNKTRLIATSNYQYAIVSPKLASKNWRTVSVNGDKVVVSTTNGEVQRTMRAIMGEPIMSFIESVRDELANSDNAAGYSHVSLASGGGSTFSDGSGGFMMSSNTAGGSGGAMASSMSSSSGYSGGQHHTSSVLGGGRGEMSYNMKDKDNFSVSRSDLPFGWSRVFINGDLVTVVFKNGDVEMLPLSSLESRQAEAVQRIRSDLKDVQQSQQKHIANTMQQSLDMVSSVFNNIMNSFPKPPDYQSSVGGMFGNNFPFGPNNSPFSAAAGWPFASGSGASAVAVAGR